MKTFKLKCNIANSTTKKRKKKVGNFWGTKGFIKSVCERLSARIKLGFYTGIKKQHGIRFHVGAKVDSLSKLFPKGLGLIGNF